MRDPPPVEIADHRDMAGMDRAVLQVTRNEFNREHIKPFQYIQYMYLDHVIYPILYVASNA